MAAVASAAVAAVVDALVQVPPLRLRPPPEAKSLHASRQALAAARAPKPIEERSDRWHPKLDSVCPRWGSAPPGPTLWDPSGAK